MRFALPVLAVAAVASALPQTTSSAPPSFKITNVVSGGTGCPQGSIDVQWTDDKVLPINFGTHFTASVGPKSLITESRKFCQLNLELSYSAGYSFAVYSASYAGFADLDPGVTGVVKSTYYFSGEAAQTSTSTTLTGPQKSRFSKTDTVDVPTWSSCAGTALLNVDASVSLTPLAGPGSGVLGVSRESGVVREGLWVVWRKCEDK